MGGGINEKTSSGGHPTVKIVLERCPRTEKALQELQDYHHHHHPAHCSVCGSNEELIDLQKYGWTPVQSQLFKKRVLEWTLEVSASSDGGRGGNQPPMMMMMNGWSCEGCMAQFEMLALVQRQIADLVKKEKEIVSQLKKRIGNRLGVISHPNLPEPGATASFILDVNDEMPTPIMTDAPNDEDVGLDLNPVILEEGVLVDEVQDRNPLQWQPDEDTGDNGLYEDTISEEEEMNDPDQGGTMEEDQPGPNKSKRCNVRTTQVREDILPNEDEIDDDDAENEEYSPTIESDTDSDEPDDRNGGGMPSNPSTSVRKEDDNKRTCEVCGKQVVKLSQHMQIHRSDRQTFTCETCHKTFSTQGNLSIHRQIVHLKQLRHKCQKCGKGFSETYNLKRHLKTRIPCTELLKKRKFFCSICKGGFTTKGSLEDHVLRVHDGVKRTKCPHPKCKYRTFDKTNLERHLEIQHPQYEKEISCTICKEKFSSVKETLAHIRSNHTGTGDSTGVN